MNRHALGMPSAMPMESRAESDLVLDVKQLDVGAQYGNCRFHPTATFRVSASRVCDLGFVGLQGFGLSGIGDIALRGKRGFEISGLRVQFRL